MRAAEYIDSLRGLGPENLAGYLQATLFTYAPAQWIEVIIELIDRFERCGEADELERARYQAYLEKSLGCFPDEIDGRSEALKATLRSQLTRLLGFNRYAQRFMPVKKLILIDGGDPREAFRVVCRTLHSGSNLDEPTYNVLLAHFAHLAYKQVDDVIAFFEQMCSIYSGSVGIAQIVTRLESDLKMRRLKDLWGGSLRRQYMRELVYSGVIDTRDSILLVGPTGTSKSFIAEIIAANSQYPKLLTANCADHSHVAQQIAAAVAEAEDAAVTLLLDEVYALPLTIQELCLGEFGRTEVELRLLATSSRTVEYLEQTLKQDFWYRITDWFFRLKALSECPDDLQEIVTAYARQESVDVEELVVTRLRINHKWPGNHREMRAVVKKLCGVCRQHGSDVISLAFLADHQADIPEEVRQILGSLS
jgi:hypothetical protein